MAKKETNVTKEKEEILQTTTTALAIPSAESLPSAIGDDLDQYAGAGTGSRLDEQMVPFLYLLQKGSPQVNDRDPAYIQGARAGMILHSVTNRLWDAEKEGQGPLCVQFHSEMCEIEWIPRSQGGGFVARHPGDTPLLKEVKEITDGEGKRLRVLPNGHQLATTAEHYLLLVDTLEPVIVGLTSTGLTAHRRWNQMLLNKRVRTAGGLRVLPSFATTIRLRTFWQKNDQGDWFSYIAEDVGMVSDVLLYEEAKKLHNVAREGGLRAAPPADTSSSTEEQSSNRSEEEVPI